MATEPELRPGVLYIDGKPVYLSKVAFTRAGAAEMSPELVAAILACPPEPEPVTKAMIEAGTSFLHRGADELYWEAVPPERQAAILSGLYRAMHAEAD